MKWCTVSFYTAYDDIKIKFVPQNHPAARKCKILMYCCNLKEIIGLKERDIIMIRAVQ